MTSTKECSTHGCSTHADTGKRELAGLNEAQEAKLELIAQKLKIEPRMRILDVGCGWGGLSQYLAQKYDVDVDGITISKEQAKLAQERTKNDSVTIRLTDYRDLKEKPYDRIVSVGMFEHVGYKNYRTYMAHMHRLLKDDGLFLLHTIGGNRTVYATDPWLDKYIFPNGMLPSIQQIGASLEKLFVMEDWHNFGPSYDKTLCAWCDNFSRVWPNLFTSGRYDERFKRMWSYYLLSSAATFRSRKTQLWQIVLSKHGQLGGYKSIR